MNIYEALSEINKKVVPIKKEKTNQQQGFKYRSIDQVMNDLHGLFAEHGVFITSEVISAAREERTNAKGTVLIWSQIDYRFILTSMDGTYITTTVKGEAMDSGDKGSNKCYSVALKYALFGMFLIPTEEMKDPDVTAHEVKPIVNLSLPEITANSDLFKKALNAIRLGYTIEAIKTKYTMSLAIEQQLKQEAGI